MHVYLYAGAVLFFILLPILFFSVATSNIKSECQTDMYIRHTSRINACYQPCTVCERFYGGTLDGKCQSYIY